MTTVSTPIQAFQPHPGIWVEQCADRVGRATVLFINMPLREHARPNTIPLGPALMAARLRDYGASCSIFDLNAHRPLLTPGQVETALVDHLNQHGEPHVVGLSGLITTLYWQITTAHIVRKLLPDVFLVSGGGLATDLPDQLFEWIPELDAVATGEGDDVVFKIVSDAVELDELGRPFGDEGAQRRLPPYFGCYRGQRPRDLDSLPMPAWDLCRLDVYLPAPIWGVDADNSSATPFTMRRSVNGVSSRGCPFACKYCDRTATGGRTYGVRSAENLLIEAQTLMQRYDVDFIGWVDDNAMVRPDRLARMAEVFAPLKDQGLRWGTHGRLDEAADLAIRNRRGGYDRSRPPRVKHMADAGCVYVGFGPESADAETLRRMDKGGQTLAGNTIRIGGFDVPESMVVGLQNCRDYGVHANCTWIMGYPGETLRALKATVRFILWMQEEGYNPPGTCNRSMFVATAYPGTEMFNDPIVVGKIREAFGGDLKRYVLELDDATKLITGDVPLNYSAMDLSLIHISEPTRPY